MEEKKQGNGPTYKVLYDGDFVKYNKAVQIYFELEKNIPVIAVSDNNIDAGDLDIRLITKEELQRRIKAYIFPNKEQVVILTENKMYVNFTPKVTISEEESNSIFSRVLTYFLTRKISLVECGDIQEMINMVIKARKSQEDFKLMLGLAMFGK